MLPSLRPQPLWGLRPTLRRFISTSQPCLRKRKSVQNEERSRAHAKQLFENEARKNQTRPVLLSSGDANIDRERFVRTIDRRIEFLRYSASAIRMLKHKGLNVEPEERFNNLVTRFRDATMNNLEQQLDAQNYTYAPYRIPAPETLYQAHAFGGIKVVDEVILDYFNSFSVTFGDPAFNEADETRLQQCADARNPGEWYPEARAIRRKIIMHVGPTNSGKTYQALQRLETAKAGWYGGPLRLLAHEIFNKMNTKGIPCNLRTGEEIRIIDPKAPLTASTIEMFQESVEYDIAVIDEIQMIGHKQRGYAWSAALLGLRSKEIHLCGEEAAVPLIQKIVAELGDEMEVHTYQRLSPLAMEQHALISLKHVEPGDCVVGFSRTSLFSIKKQIEDQTGLQCAMVYGALPPETRALQAQLFNDPDSDYEVIVASDAIGMGLNLNIKRIIFYTMEKYDEGGLHRIYNSQIKQIAGRAGRYRVDGAPDEEDHGGLVTTFSPADQQYLRDGIQTPNEPIEKAYLWPPFRTFEKFAQQLPEGAPLATLLSQFSMRAHTTPYYCMISNDEQIQLAQSIDDVRELDLETRYNLIFAPFSTRNEVETTFFKRCAEAYAAGKPVTIENHSLSLPFHIIGTVEKMTSSKLHSLEVLHKLVMCYCWLATRYPAIYSNYNLALSWKAKTELAIHKALLEIQPRKQTPLERKKEKRGIKKMKKLETRVEEGDPHAITRMAELTAPPKPRPIGVAEQLEVA